MIISDYVKNEFGSKKGFLRYLWFQILLKLGFYRRYKKIEFSNVNRLIFVCMGNICRSPLAEAVAKKHGISSLSYGLNTQGGKSADDRTIEYAKHKNLDVVLHKTKKIDEYNYQKGDLLVVMEPLHLKMLPKILDDVPVTLAGLWLGNPIIYIHDPYNTTACYFAKCELLVELSTEKLISELK